MGSNVLTFVIVGHDDRPIFEADLSPKAADPAARDERTQYLHQFVLHASLDAVDELVWSTTSMHLGVVDKFNALQVSAFVTAANVKFLLLHDGRSDDAIKLFFRDVYENVYLKATMNPFFVHTARITSPAFNQKIRTLARTYFRT